MPVFPQFSTKVNVIVGDNPTAYTFHATTAFRALRWRERGRNGIRTRCQKDNRRRVSVLKIPVHKEDDRTDFQFFTQLFERAIATGGTSHGRMGVARHERTTRVS
eukprot:scaffold2103_cov185-Amphora_coffeaeformis.AAC.15